MIFSHMLNMGSHSLLQGYIYMYTHTIKYINIFAKYPLENKIFYLVNRHIGQLCLLPLSSKFILFFFYSVIKVGLVERCNREC